MDFSVIKNRLDSINWNFDFTIDYGENELRPFNCRKYYSYPATFIPEIPYAFIEILSNKGDVVLDPFGGIGTTFLQALSLEREPYSYDINPVASSVCKVLYMLLNPSEDKQAIERDLLLVCEGYDKKIDYSANLSDKRKELAGWFEKETFNEVSFLFQKYDCVTDGFLKEVMKMVISSILVTLSSQNKGWAYIADNVKPKADEFKKKAVFEQYRASVKSLMSDIIDHEAKLPETYASFYSTISSRTRVIEDSVTNTDIKNGTVDLVITSPPYPRMIDYVKSQRLSFGFANKSFSDYVGNEIGARYRRNRSSSLRDYKDDIIKVNDKIAELLKVDGYACFVLPDYDSTDERKEIIDSIVNDFIGQVDPDIKKIKKRDFEIKKVFEVGRYIPSHKRTTNIQWATLVNEKIIVFQKVKKKDE